MTSEKQQANALILLRTVVAVLLFIHGAARIYLGIVDDFGVFLTSAGLPFGIYVAWAITVFEILGSFTLAAGYFVPLLALVFAVHLTTGIFLVHIHDGWFVVGAGRNGAEYSFLLVAVLLALAYSQYSGRQE